MAKNAKKVFEYLKATTEKMYPDKPAYAAIGAVLLASEYRGGKNERLASAQKLLDAGCSQVQLDRGLRLAWNAASKAVGETSA